jgi:thiol-disulfide isomerase/thioredoxin
MRPTARLAVLTACLACLASWAGEPITLIQTGHYQLRVGEELDRSARIYKAAKLPKFLLVAEKLTRPLLVTAGDRSVVGIDPTAVTSATGDPDAVLLDPAATTAISTIATLDGLNLRFVVDGAKLQIEPADPLLGPTELSAVLDALPEWRRNAAAYKPMIGDVRLLDTLQSPIEVEIFFGSWCPHCEKSVPKVARLVRELKTANLKFKFHGVPVKFDEDPIARMNRIAELPTGIVRQAGKEIARLAETSWERPESALTAVLLGQLGGGS